jgi:hypothetical protein
MNDTINLIEKKYGRDSAIFVLGYLNYLIDQNDIKYNEIDDFCLKNLPEKVISITNSDYDIKGVIINEYMFYFHEDIEDEIFNEIIKYIDNANNSIKHVLKDMFDLYTSYKDIFYFDKLSYIYNNKKYIFESEAYNYDDDSYNILIFKENE